ncbi:MAG: mannitol dehydrogenase family protein [Lachnospiraceae bacterium]|nr:mannitol dehydrogenase family protein [Lachnospiraceae bacterium]
MLSLTLNGIGETVKWEDNGIKLPCFDIEKMRKNTAENPVWIHFGAGNIFRGFIANLQQKLLDEGLADTGIIAADTFDFDMIEKIYVPFDNLVLNVGLKADGNTDLSVIASIADAVKCDFSNACQKEKLIKAVTNPSLQMISFTITEKGYSLRNMAGDLLPNVIKDMNEGPKNCTHAMSVTAALLLERFKAGKYPIAVCSMDNCSHNGEKLKSSVSEIINAWAEKGFVTKEFADYVSDETKVSFPWSMIDKITPRPAKAIENMLHEKGIDGMKAVITDKNTFIAPFVNAEIPEYLVIEDRFPNGRPALEKAGVYFADRDTVNNTEKMKVTTCLNPLHTAMAVFGCLLGYDHIAKEMKDEDIHKLVENIGYREGLPVVVNPGIIDPKKFIDEVVEERLPNMFIPDMPQRIATDTSMKIPIRFGETIKSYKNASDRDVNDLVFIPLAIAAWFRYLLGIDDEGSKMEVSSDPQLSDLQEKLEGIMYDDVSSYKGQLLPILSNEAIFASDLTETGLSEKIEGMFKEMLAGKGSVRKALHKYVTEY